MASCQELIDLFKPRSLSESSGVECFRAFTVAELKRFLQRVGLEKGKSSFKKEQLVDVCFRLWDEKVKEERRNVVALPANEQAVMPPQTSPCMSSSVSESTTTHTENILYPILRRDMTMADFEQWTIPQLKSFLSDREINQTGNKRRLVQNAFGAFQMDFPVTAEDLRDELHSVKQSRG